MAKYLDNNELSIEKCPMVEPNNNIIANIHIDDLNYIELDLDFNQKVSLVFLLYGGTPLKAKYGLQILLIAYQSPTTYTTFLQEWVQSQSNLNWKMVLIEALWTIKSVHVLQRLGLDVDDLRARFLDPENAEVNLYIHPILKGLYCIVCEKLHLDDAKKLIKFVYCKSSCRLDVDFTDEKYLEVFLLHWLSELVIEAGEWCSKKRSVFCNLEKILDYLKLQKKTDLVNELIRIVNRFNYTSNNVTSIERKKNVTTDDALEDENPKLARQNLRRRDSYSNSIQDESDDKYVIERDTAGYVLIINQIKFYRDPVRMENLPSKHLEKRHGSVKDAKALKHTFSSFGYNIIEKENLTDLEMVSEIEDVVSKSGTCDSLIVCILSHGSKGLIYGANSVPVLIEQIEDKIVSKQLLNRPKILILQSCQGEDLQIAETMVNKKNNLTDSNKLAHDGPNETIPMRCDFYMANSTIPGFASIRHIENGSWFIQNLCDVINEYSDRKHFLDIMTKVHKRVTDLRGDKNECMVPMCKITFRKEFYFPPKLIAKV